MKVQDIGTWEAFYHVAREGNFTKAARKMNIGLPLLSRRIAKLESELGIRLFQRSTRKVGLTSEGKGLLPQLSTILDDLREVESQFGKKELLDGKIRLTCLPAMAHRVVLPIL